MKAPSQEPLVSVVTPFYNTGRYLAECIESVLAQSYQNWEYILVNNCSADESPEIANHYAAKDGRIRVVTNESFLTQVQNYNRALGLISPESKYCKIVQADDWIFPHCLTQMVEVAEMHPSVGIIGAYRLDDTMVNCDGLPYRSTFVPGRDICRLSLMGRCFVFGSPTSIMFRSDIVRKREPFYAESTHHEDTEACYDILRDHDFGFVHQVLTFTRRENESISSLLRKWDPSHILDGFIALTKYGSTYLGEDELRTISKRVEKELLQFIAKSFLQGSGIRALLKYHEGGLKSTRYRLSRIKLSLYISLELLNMILNPKMTLGRLARRFVRASQ